MTAGWAIAIPALAALAALAVVAIRRARRRRAELLAALLAAVRRALADTPDVELAGDRIVARHASGVVSLPHDRLLRAAARGHSAAAVAEAVVLLLRTPLQPHPGPLGIKLHGPRIRACLLPAAALPLLPGEPRWATHPVAGLPLVATYRIDGRADACLTEDHLREQAIDARDLHGIALAVLRQEFDEDLVRRLAADGAVPEVVTAAGGSATATLLVLPDFLPADLAVEAVLAAPDRLELRPLAPTAEPEPAPAPPLRLRVDRQGWRIR